MIFAMQVVKVFQLECDLIMLSTGKETPVQMTNNPHYDTCFGRDLALAPETCEELFTPAAPHIFLALSGIEVFSNGSGSHHQVLYSDTVLHYSKNLSGSVAQFLKSNCTVLQELL